MIRQITFHRDLSYFDFFRAPQTLKSGLPDQAAQTLVKIQSAK